MIQASEHDCDIHQSSALIYVTPTKKGTIVVLNSHNIAGNDDKSLFEISFSVVVCIELSSFQ